MKLEQWNDYDIKIVGDDTWYCAQRHKVRETEPDFEAYKELTAEVIRRVNGFEELYAENQSLKTEIDFFRGIADENKALKADRSWIKRWVQRVHDKETTLEEFYSVLRYHEPLKPVVEAALQSKEE